eukprot:gene7060-7853_t
MATVNQGRTAEINDNRSGKQLLNLPVANNAQHADIANSENNQDADIFIAEIFPEQPGNFEQLFRPLIRYRKATLSLDAQIEPTRTTEQVPLYEKQQFNSLKSNYIANGRNIVDLGKERVNIRKEYYVPKINEQFNQSAERMDDSSSANNESITTYDSRDFKTKINDTESNSIKDMARDIRPELSKNHLHANEIKAPMNDTFLNQTDENYSGFGESGSGQYGDTTDNGLLTLTNGTEWNENTPNANGTNNTNNRTTTNWQKSKEEQERRIMTKEETDVDGSGEEKNENHSFFQSPIKEGEKEDKLRMMVEKMPQEIAHGQQRTNNSFLQRAGITGGMILHSEIGNYSSIKQTAYEDVKEKTNKSNVNAIGKEEQESTKKTKNVTKNKENEKYIKLEETIKPKNGSDEVHKGQAKAILTSYNEITTEARNENIQKQVSKKMKMSKQMKYNNSMKLINAKVESVGNKVDEKETHKIESNSTEKQEDKNQKLSNEEAARKLFLSVVQSDKQGKGDNGGQIISTAKEKEYKKQKTKQNNTTNNRNQKDRKINLAIKMMKVGQKKRKMKGEKKEKHHRHGKKKSRRGKYQIRNDLAFERMLVSEKARQLYLNLINDTRRAFLVRKNHLDKRRRQHSEHRKEFKENQQALRKSKAELNMKISNQKFFYSPRISNLAQRILHAMAENGKHFVDNTKFANSSNKFDVDNHGIHHGLLDSKSSLLEKLAQVSYQAADEKLEEENAKLLKKNRPGLAGNFNMDLLDGRKDHYQSKNLDGDIEGELSNNINNTALDKKETDLDNLSTVQNKPSLKNLTEEEQSKNSTNNVLYIYNEEESLKGSGMENEEDDDITNGIYLQSLHKHLKESKISLNQDEKLNWKGDFNNMYFAGNRSSWRNHPMVSMNITPLVKIYYDVHHQNLVDLVENKSKKKINGNIHGYNSHVPRYHQINFMKQKIMKAKSKKHPQRKKKSQHNKKSNHKKRTNFNKMKHKKPARMYASSRSQLNTKGPNKIGNSAEIPTINNNMPRDVNYYKIENAVKFGALCIDGSIPGYYYRPGNSSGKNKWIIHLHGGAWCYNLETCYRRSLSLLGSTNHWSSENITNFFQGILSGRKESNPDYYNWNVVVQTYCDGGLFSGNRKEPLFYKDKQLYFRGRTILKSMIASLNERNLKHASDVLLSGTSAGGLAVILQGEYIKRKLPITANVRILVDAGFFLDAPGNGWPNIIQEQFQGLYVLHQPKLKLQCLKTKNNTDKFKCLFPQNFLEYVRNLPIFFVNSLYDHWQLSELQGLHCVYNNDKCLPNERNRIIQFRNIMFSIVKQTLRNLKSVGLYANSCFAHGQAIVDYTWSHVRVNNRTIREAFNDWLQDKGENNEKHFDVDCKYPCNGSCPKPMVNSCITNFKRTTLQSRLKRYAELC